MELAISLDDRIDAEVMLLAEGMRSLYLPQTVI
jgi:hypothetical protein